MKIGCSLPILLLQQIFCLILEAGPTTSPTITSLSPNSGSASKTTKVTIRGNNLNEENYNTKIVYGSSTESWMQLADDVSSRSVTGYLSGSPGTVTVKVRTADDPDGESNGLPFTFK